MSYLSINNNAFVKHSFLQENNNQIRPSNGTTDTRTIQEVWSKFNFQTKPIVAEPINKPTWDEFEEKKEEKEKMVDEDEESQAVEKEEEALPSHHARRPMNAFLIFCKKHRPIVRDRFPNLENRGVTKILGEWWALLDEQDKAPYTCLAKEYKDAFLTANPDFKWYKLPAPPRRTLSVRPSSTHKIQSPVSSPTVTNVNFESEFTPGKLADESQLGSLTSLMNNNFSPTIRVNENNNNIEKNGDEVYDNTLISPVSNITPTLPPKPFKKRIFDKYPDNNNTTVSRSILNDDISPDMTNQDLVDKVVDKYFTKQDDFEGLKSKDIRKSGRQCKGKRYEKFMVEGRLLGNKRDTKLTSQKDNEFVNYRLENKPETETPNLGHTIKRLAERTNMESLLEIKEDKPKTLTVKPQSNTNNDFNLDLKIQNLPSLSYDAFHQKKKESKKRKNRTRTDSETKIKIPKMEPAVVGSKKRKNKQSITHLEKKEEGSINDGLLALATLAEIAANTEKIGD